MPQGAEEEGAQPVAAVAEARRPALQETHLQVGHEADQATRRSQELPQGQGRPQPAAAEVAHLPAAQMQLQPEVAEVRLSLAAGAAEQRRPAVVAAQVWAAGAAAQEP